MNNTQISEKVNKLIIGNTYYVRDTKYEFIDKSRYKKCKLVGFCGHNNKLIHMIYSKQLIGRVFERDMYFSTSDYCSNAVAILTPEEYKEHKRREIWESIEKEIANL